MATTTLVGVFDDEAQARAAAKGLGELGVSHRDITVARSDYAGGYRTSAGESDSTIPAEGGGIGRFFRELFGADVDDHDRGLYSEAVRRGSSVVSVDIDSSQVDSASDILTRHGAVDVDQRSAQYRATGYTAYDEQAPSYTAEQSRAELESFSSQREIALPVIEEELQVGTRTVQRGGVRIHTRVSDRPVEERVTLREEQVHVERRPVDRDVTDADLARMKDGAIDITTTAEEAVVGKRARVVEEVVVEKDVVQREETIRDTVRRTDVDVEQVQPGASKTSSKDRSR